MRLDRICAPVIVLSLACLLASFLGTASAANYPAATDDYVNDIAGVLTPADAQSIKKEFAVLERQSGKEFTLVTFNSLSDYAADSEGLERFATGLFNEWGVGDKKKNDGVLIALAVKDQEVRIVLGEGYPASFDRKAKDIIETSMVPHFKDGDLSRGAYEGATAAVATLSQPPTFWESWGVLLLILAGVITLVLLGISLINSGKKGWGWGSIIAAGAILIFVISILARSKSKTGFGGGRSSGGGAGGKW